MIAGAVALALVAEVPDVRAQAQADARWTRLMAFQTARTRTLLDAGRPLLAELPWRARLEIGAVIAGGLRIVKRIENVRGDVFRHRPTLGTIDWIAVAARALAVTPRDGGIPVGRRQRLRQDRLDAREQLPRAFDQGIEFLTHFSFPRKPSSPSPLGERAGVRAS